MMTEQIAVSNVTAMAIVLCGMLTTSVLLFGAALTASITLFPDRLVQLWSASLDGPVVTAHYLLLSSVVTAFSVAIGSFGAIFENQSYFRHVTFVDEEF